MNRPTGEYSPTSYPHRLIWPACPTPDPPPTRYQSVMELLELSTWPAVKALNRDTPVVVPIAALEQHGRHMPVFTDCLLLGEVLRRVKADAGDRRPVRAAAVARQLAPPPRLPRHAVGLAARLPRHAQRPGSRLHRPRLHAGSCSSTATAATSSPRQQALFELKQDPATAATCSCSSLTYWDARPATHRESFRAWCRTQMGHACEWETSMMLRLGPQLVVGEVARCRRCRSARRSRRLPRLGHADRSEPGHIGHPSSATAEKGEALFRPSPPAWRRSGAASRLGRPGVGRMNPGRPLGGWKWCRLRPLARRPCSTTWTGRRWRPARPSSSSASTTPSTGELEEGFG